MAVNPYTSQSISGYNATPPPDDGSQTSANKVEWAKHKSKLADPIKTLVEGVNTQANTSFNTVYLWTATAWTSSATIAEGAHSDFLAANASVVFPGAGTLENGWHTFIHNTATTNINLVATDSIDGVGSMVLAPNEGVMVLNTATTYFTLGRTVFADLTASDIVGTIIATQIFS